jgi:membrane-associated protease RseP (regulator of RpoE activity)
VNPAAGQPPRGARNRYWLHALLLVLTLITTSAVGARLDDNFRQNRPFLAEDLIAVLLSLQEPWTLTSGLPFAVTLITILLAHEMGHYLTCRYYGIDASLPYFLPAPTLIGTLGAFIRIRSPILWRAQLFDVGVAGPVAGFVFIVPALAIGLAYSKVIPGIANQSDFVFSTPIFQRLLELAIFPGTPPQDIFLHPIARAAWVGLFATALNLMPIGQLDGGHILYSFVGDRHRFLTNVFILALIPLAFLSSSWSWLFWALILFVLGRKHPKIYDHRPLGSGRVQLAILALAMFIVCFSPTPVDAG